MPAFRILCFVLLSIPCSVLAQSQIDIQKLGRFFQSLEQNDRFMGSVSILQGNETIFSKAYGITDSEGSPASPGSVYRIGSVTKTFTATMIMRLVEQEALSLSDRLAGFFPSLPNADRISIRHLLQHSSGLINITALPDYREYHTETQSRESMLARFEAAGTSFQPGERREYSNTGYILLGFIIEEVTGAPYARALREMIVEPLGLDSTWYSGSADARGEEAESFSYREEEWVPVPATDSSVPHGAGAVVASSEDTARFMRALMNGELVNEASLEQMKDFEGTLGLGLLRLQFPGTSAVGHNGGIDGFMSSAGHFVEQDITYALIANAVNYDFSEILTGFGNIVLGRDYTVPDFTIPESIDLTREQMDAFTGNYTSPGAPIDLRLFIEDGRLMGQGTGQSAFPLTVIDEHTLIYEAAGVQLLFEPAADGSFQRFTMEQRSMSFEFSREE